MKISRFWEREGNEKHTQIRITEDDKSRQCCNFGCWKLH